MIPPTPTPFPPGTPVFIIPSNYSLWGSAPFAVQSWNMLGDGRYVIQVIFLIAFIIAGMYILQRFAQDFTRKDAEE